MPSQSDRVSQPWRRPIPALRRARHWELPGLLIVVADLRIATSTGAALKEAAVALVATVVVVPQDLGYVGLRIFPTLWIMKGLCMGYIWFIYGLYMGYIWVIYGYIWVIYGLYPIMGIC